jgi:hypothetical protein
VWTFSLVTRFFLSALATASDRPNQKTPDGRKNPAPPDTICHPAAPARKSTDQTQHFGPGSDAYRSRWARKEGRPSAREAGGRQKQNSPGPTRRSTRTSHPPEPSSNAGHALSETLFRHCQRKGPGKGARVRASHSPDAPRAILSRLRFLARNEASRTPVTEVPNTGVSRILRAERAEYLLIESRVLQGQQPPATRETPPAALP